MIVFDCKSRWYYPLEMEEVFRRHASEDGRKYSFQIFNLHDLAAKNGILGNQLTSYHTEIWGKDIDSWTYDESKMTNPSDYIYIDHSNGQYKVSNGKHRLRALLNMGYTEVELPVLEDE